MKYRLIIRPLALAEYEEAVAFHESNRKGSGRRLGSIIDKALKRISRTPLVNPTIYGDARKAVVVGTRYCIYYYVEDNSVVVFSVFHSSRDPSIWKRRIDRN